MLKATNNFRFDQEGSLPEEAWQRLLNGKGSIKTKMRLNTRYLGAHSIFRLTTNMGTKFVFEISDPQKGESFVVMIPSDSARESYEDRTYLGECYIGLSTIEIGGNLIFHPVNGQLRIVRNIQKIEILEEHSVHEVI